MVISAGLKKLDRDEHSSLTSLFVSDFENIFITMAPEFFFLTDDEVK